MKSANSAIKFLQKDSNNTALILTFEAYTYKPHSWSYSPRWQRFTSSAGPASCLVLVGEGSLENSQEVCRAGNKCVSVISKTGASIGSGSLGKKTDPWRRSGPRASSDFNEKNRNLTENRKIQTFKKL